MTTTPVAATRLEWVFHTRTPPDWADCIRQCNGGFFHSPPGLRAGSPAGRPFFVELRLDEELMGIAAGVRHACRFGRLLRHAYFPSLPAMRDPALRAAGLEAVYDAMRAEDVDDIVIDSFDASWRPESFEGGVATARRAEYIVRIDPASPIAPVRFADQHRRRCTRGIRHGWTIRPVAGRDAASILAAVQQNAAERASARGDGFRADPPAADALERGSEGDDWGLTTFGAWNGDTLLAAVVIGWANRRAFYVSGGSTPAGYEHGAAAWLHWRLMNLFAERGFNRYNLGGAPLPAGAGPDPASGLRRFKAGFNTETVELHGLRWEIESPHIRAHKFKLWMSRSLTWRR